MPTDRRGPTKRKHLAQSGGDQNSIPMESSSRVKLSDSTIFGGWLDEGISRGTGDIIEHEGFWIWVDGQRLEFMLGDTAFVRCETRTEDSTDGKDLVKASAVSAIVGVSTASIGMTTASTKDENELMVARIERLWEAKKSPPSVLKRDAEDVSSPFMFRARWFLKKSEMKSLGDTLSRDTWDSTFANCLVEDELVLSNHADDSPITTIAGDVLVLYRKPAGSTMGRQDSTTDLAWPTTLPSSTFICRYSVGFSSPDYANDIIRIFPFTGPDDVLSDFVSPNGEKKAKRFRCESSTRTQELQVIVRNKKLKKPHSMRDDSSDDIGGGCDDSNDGTSGDSDSETSRDTTRGAAISEGNILKRDIRVGVEYQVVMPSSFAPNAASIQSRRPRAVWKPQKISNSEIKSFLTRASRILIPYIREKCLTHEEPYSPLPWDNMESLAEQIDYSQFPTLSTICTASSLSGKRTDMLREVDIDSLLGLFHDNSYNIEASLTIVEKSPGSYVTAWYPEEKERLNAAFRRYAGSFRMVHKALSSSKSFKDVIDYVYRFKIPDQYRLFQEVKQEQAIRMIEDIEAKRSARATISVSREDVPNSRNLTPRRRIRKDHWQKTPVSDITGATQSRRIVAKRALLDIEEQLGKQTLADVMNVIQNFRSEIAGESRASLTQILDGHELLLRQILEFLPRQF